jgi:hypothetical protein
MAWVIFALAHQDLNPSIAQVEVAHLDIHFPFQI